MFGASDELHLALGSFLSYYVTWPKSVLSEAASPVYRHEIHGYGLLQ